MATPEALLRDGQRLVVKRGFLEFQEADDGELPVGAHLARPRAGSEPRSTGQCAEVSSRQEHWRQQVGLFCEKLQQWDNIYAVRAHRQGSIPEAPEPPRRVPALEEGTRAESAPEEPAPAPPRPDPAYSRGSKGHPYLCSRPCKFVSSGMCENGAECAHRHLQHEVRPGHFSKRVRSQWKGLTAEARSAAAVAALSDRVHKLNLGPEGMEALSTWSNQVLGQDVAEDPRFQEEQPQAVNKGLVGHTLRSLCNMALHGSQAAVDNVEADARTTQFLHALCKIMISKTTQQAP